MRCIITLAIVSMLQGTALSQSTWFVDVTATPPGTGSSASPYSGIQYAIDRPSTLSGDTLLVRPGVYVENVDYAGKDLAVRSIQGPVATILTPTAMGNMSAVSLISGEGAGALLEGFTLTGGQPSNDRGGAIYCVDSSLRVVDCIVRNNSAYEGYLWAENASLELDSCVVRDNDGAGLGLLDADVRVTSCRFEQNEQIGGPGSGAWITSSDAVFTDCEFFTNVGTFGSVIYSTDASNLEFRECRFDSNMGFSAIYATSGTLDLQAIDFTLNAADFDNAGAVLLENCVASLVGCSFVENRAGGDDYRGGALFARNSDLTVIDTVFSGNFSARGGGSYTEGGKVRYEGCWFEENRAAQLFCCNGGSGGGLGANAADDAVAERCVFIRNRADGFGFHPAPAEGYDEGWGGAVIGGVQLLSCTLVDNFADAEGGAAYGSTLNGCVVRGNVPAPLGGGASATFSNVEGGALGIGNIDEPAGFIDAPNDNYHLAPGSACIDAGDRTSALDLDGSRADMGAFQFPDCNGNGQLDLNDISAGISLDRNGNGFPDECECLALEYCESAAHSAGPGARMAFAGSASTSANDLVLLAVDCPPGRPGLFFYGTAGGAAPFGDGVRCVFGTTFRLGVVHASQQGLAAYPVDLANPPQAAGQVTPGSRWFFQFWFRDPGGPGGSAFNLSNGLEVVFCP